MMLDVAGAVKTGIRSALTAGGGLLGGLVGAPTMGAAAGSWLSKVTGFGDYTVNSNTLVSGGVPTFKHGERKVVISHREFITDVTGSTNFTVSSYPLNPGNPAVFPWLSTVAASYQQYRFKGLLFEYCSSSASALNSTNTALGTVIMATNYNVSRPNYASKIEMEASEFSCRTKPSESLIHPIECNPEETPLKHMYIRTGPVPSGQDQRFYDLANFQIAFSGMQASATIGELWVTYEVELLKPRLPSQIAGVSSLEWAYRKQGTYSNTDPLNTGGLIINTFGGLDVRVSNRDIIFGSNYSSGTFMVIFHWIGTGAVTASFGAPTLTANASLNSNYFGGAGFIANGGSSVVSCTFTVVLNINSFLTSGTTLTLNSLVLPTGGNYAYMYVAPAPSAPESNPF